jgi:hypothetical protein
VDFTGETRRTARGIRSVEILSTRVDCMSTLLTPRQTMVPYCDTPTRVLQNVMQTLVLRIPDDLAKELEAEAKKARLTKSEVARRRLIAAGPQAHAAPSGIDLIADLIGSIDGGPADMSSRKKDYLKSTGYGKSRPR